MPRDERLLPPMYAQGSIELPGICLQQSCAANGLHGNAGHLSKGEG